MTIENEARTADESAVNTPNPSCKERSDAEVAAWLATTVHEGAQLRLDSREVQPGDIFCAIPGAHTDGRRFIRVAVARGAAGVLLEPSQTDAPVAGPEHHQLPVLAVPNLSKRLGAIAAHFYGNPSARMAGIAVTGTNGKTTTTFWTRELLDALDAPCAVIGTIGAFLQGERLPGPHLTTPDALSLERLYAQALSCGAKAFAVEASSVGLEQGRLDGSHFRAGIFTNLTRDHLDYHGTMEAYAAAKEILFTWPEMGAAIVNADDPLSERFAKTALAHGIPVWTIGLDGNARALAERVGATHVLDALEVAPSGHGMCFTLDFDGVKHEVSLPALGRFNVENALGAIAAVVSLGYALTDVLALVPALTCPPGRMQIVASKGMPLGVVDFCHTPDAITKAIESLLPTVRARGGRLWTVFGCGGDRDPGKRPMMGNIAARLSDEVVVTSDNPRTEEPQSIIDAIVAGCAGATNVRALVDRREAIYAAVLEATSQDVILVAGKGHENEQILCDGPHPFLDVEVLREAFNERRVVLHARD